MKRLGYGVRYCNLVDADIPAARSSTACAPLQRLVLFSHRYLGIGRPIAARSTSSRSRQPARLVPRCETRDPRSHLISARSRPLVETLFASPSCEARIVRPGILNTPRHECCSSATHSFEVQHGQATFFDRIIPA